MRRCLWPALVGLLVAVAHSGAAQQRPSAPAVTLEPPRPLPLLPAVLVPFMVPIELCRDGKQPTTSLKVRDIFAREVAVLRLRGEDRTILDRAPIGCGRFVGIWDGTVDDGERLATNGVYYIQISVSGAARPRAVQVLVPKLG